MVSMPYDAGNRKDVRAAEKQSKLVEQQRREIVTGIMSVAPGRSWMCDLLEHCHIFHTSFHDSSNRMSFMEGQREVGIRLLSDIMGACPDSYVLMMRERNERDNVYDARRSRKDTNGGNRQPDSDDGPRDDGSDLYDPDGDPEHSEPVR
jgi:hypothetical protein